jgi:YHS domain-containing protein
MTGLDIPNRGTRDPVCGMTVRESDKDLEIYYNGRAYFFCSEGCREAFAKNPEQHLKPESDKKKGWFGRFLDQMARANEEEFGQKGPRCCN